MKLKSFKQFLNEFELEGEHQDNDNVIITFQIENPRILLSNGVGYHNNKKAILYFGYCKSIIFNYFRNVIFSNSYETYQFNPNDIEINEQNEKLLFTIPKSVSDIFKKEVAKRKSSFNVYDRDAKVKVDAPNFIKVVDVYLKYIAD